MNVEESLSNKLSPTQVVAIENVLLKISSTPLHKVIKEIEKIALPTLRSLTYIWDETEEQYVGYLSQLPHIVAYGKTLLDLENELFKSINILLKLPKEETPIQLASRLGFPPIGHI